MKFSTPMKTLMNVALVSLGISIVMGQSVMAQTRLGLHVTQEELNIWKQRAVSGPYQSAGDVSPNSPGDWQRIQNNAGSFLSNTSAERWSGQPSGSCWSADSSSPARPGRTRGEKLRDAAFYYLIIGDTKYRDAVKNELLAQAATAGTNWTDTTRWMAESGCAEGDAWSHEIMNWLTKLLYGYDYIRPSLSSPDRTTIDTWFLNAALFWEDVQRRIIEARFPDRNSDDYTVNDGYLPKGDDGSSPRVTHYGGWLKRGFHEGWNNRAATQVRFYTLVGVLLDHSYLRGKGKRFFKEFLKYHVFPDGTDADFHRWESTYPGLGWSYASHAIGDMATVADAFARIGDTELYNFSTSDGMFGTEGGLKTLKQVITMHLNHVNHTVLRYGTDQSANNGNPNYLSDSDDQLAEEFRVEDTSLTPANVFYQDSFVKSIYTRTARGAPPYPSNPATSGEGSAWGGSWNTYPGVLFMFGQMEGKVWSYSTPLPAPTKLRVISSGE